VNLAEDPEGARSALGGEERGVRLGGMFFLPTMASAFMSAEIACRAA